MNLKDELLKLKGKILQNNTASVLSKDDETKQQNVEILVKKKICKNIDLETKVDEFISWYTDKYVKGQYTDIGEYNEPKRIRDFIEKMAVWYELRYPEYEVNRLYHCCGQSPQQIDNIMINQNNAFKGIAEILDDDKAKEFMEVVSILEWNKLYSKESFINSLPYEETYYLNSPKYSDLVYVNPDDRYKSIAAHLHLTSDGVVTESEYMQPIPGWGVYSEDPFDGMHISDVVKCMKEEGMDLPDNNELEQAINRYNNKNTMKNGLLDCVMYRIIERGGNRIGPRRAFMFAKEFERNIDIPMMYGVDLSDPGLRSFTLEYIKAGGHGDLDCFIGYGFRNNRKEKLDAISVDEIIRTRQHNCIQKYTPEENDLYKRLASVLLYYQQDELQSTTDKEKMKIKELNKD